MIDLESNEHRVLILTPLGKDAELTQSILAEAAINSEICKSIESLLAKMAGPCGAILITEEVLDRDSIAAMNSVLRQQPPWSDIPLVLLATQGEWTESTSHIWNTFAAAGNVTVLERPVRTSTLISAIQVALRARRRQYQVRRLLEDQKAATAIRDEFISIASHELKTPLTSMTLQSQITERTMVKEGGTLPAPKLKAFVQQTKSQIARLTRLVDDMLDVSRIQAGKFTLRREEFDLSTLVQEALDRFSEQLASAGCTATYDGEPCIGNWDRLRIDQIVVNLLTNAIRYAPKSRLFLTLRKTEGGVIFSFEDEGPGIAEENLERVFERFERGNPGAAAISGLGLGLYICRTIAEMHGGSIRAVKKATPGAKFVLELPRGEGKCLSEYPMETSPKANFN